MICYRVYVNLRQNMPMVEEKMRIQTFTKEFFPVFTVFNVINFHQDRFERGLCIEINSSDPLENIGEFCKAIKGLLYQDEVILTRHRVDTEVF